MRRLFLLLSLLALPGLAAGAAEPLKVEIGKTALLRMSKTPGVVVLGDPNIADIIVERGGLMLLVGRVPGETDIKVFDEEGKTLLSRPVVVTPIGARHVTVHRGVEEATMSCNPRCAGVPNQTAPGAVAPTNPAAAAAALGGAGGGPVPPGPGVPALPGAASAGAPAAGTVPTQPGLENAPPARPGGGGPALPEQGR